MQPRDEHTVTVGDIAAAIEEFAPCRLQESYDNAGLQVGNPDMPVTALLFCLDVTERILDEAVERGCNMIVSHHPLLFKGLKQLTGQTPVQRIVISALSKGIAIYAAHTNLDSTVDGVSYEMAHILRLTDLSVLAPQASDPRFGLGIVGSVAQPVPAIEFLRNVKEAFRVRMLRYSVQSPQLVIRRVAVVGGAGASLIRDAADAGADVIVTGDVKYHDYTDYASDILIADIGHYESELCSKKIFARIIRQKLPAVVTYFSETEHNPVGIM